MPKRPIDIVTDFYNALAASDADTVVSTIDDHFDDDVAFEWPPSLPHGGRIEGATKLRAVFAGIADPNAAAGAKNLKLLRTVGDSDEVIAWIGFDWKNPGEDEGIPNEALEKWAFHDGSVREVRAFYWNSDAISAPRRS